MIGQKAHCSAKKHIHEYCNLNFDFTFITSIPAIILCCSSFNYHYSPRLVDGGFVECAKMCFPLNSVTQSASKFLQHNWAKHQASSNYTEIGPPVRRSSMKHMYSGKTWIKTALADRKASSKANRFSIWLEWVGPSHATGSTSGQHGFHTLSRLETVTYISFSKFFENTHLTLHQYKNPAEQVTSTRMHKLQHGNTRCVEVSKFLGVFQFRARNSKATALLLFMCATLTFDRTLCRSS